SKVLGGQLPGRIDHRETFCRLHPVSKDRRDAGNGWKTAEEHSQENKLKAQFDWLKATSLLP
ncbi:hypothetical protein, partial [Pseudoramibacter alactolyticus]|uniref:hypothetical protein n=1 Tax=Pseudoramibacter alactolyticus TaxID=113287 RepID=UPI00248DD1A8